MCTRQWAAARKISVVLATLVLLVAGCGTDPSARVWASSVCQALTPWRTTIATLTSSTEQQMRAQTTPAQAQENLVRLFAGAEEASETARSRVAGAGVPDVEQGEEISAAFVAALAGMRDAYGKARRTIEALDTADDEAFYAGVDDAVKVLNAEYDASGLDTGGLNSEELQEAFDEVPECR